MKSPALLFTLITSALAHLAAAECPSSGKPVTNIETSILQIDENIALKQYERTKLESSKVDLDLALKLLDGSDADKALLKLKLEMLTKRGDRLLREIRERAEKIRNLQNSQTKATPPKSPITLDPPKPKPEEKKPAAVTPSAATENKALETELAEAQKKLDGLMAEYGKRREARGKLTEDSPEYATIDKQVQEMKVDLKKASEAVSAAKANLKKP